MPQLTEYTSAGGVHGIRDETPAGDMVSGVDLAGLVPAAAEEGDMGAFGNEQPGGGTLRVVVGHEGVGDVGGTGTAARHGCHDDAVRQSEITEEERGEKMGMKGGSCFG